MFVLNQYTSYEFQTLALILPTGVLRIGTLADAAEALLSHWTDHDGEEYVVAVKACVDAITGVGSAGEARSELIKAAEEAGIGVIALVNTSDAPLVSTKTAA